MRELLSDKRRFYLLILVACIAALLMFVVFFSNRRPPASGVDYSVAEVNGQILVTLEEDVDAAARSRVEAEVRANYPGKEVVIDMPANETDEGVEMLRSRIENEEEINPSTIYPDPTQVDGPGEYGENL
jgi:hypothetical protein